MPSDRGEPWPGATYNGFSGPGAPDAPPPHREAGPASRWPLSRQQTIVGGVAAAVVLGLVFGLWARPQMGPDGRVRDTLSASAEAVTPASVPIEVNRPQPLPTPRATGRMEVLPADMAQQARVSAPAAGPPRAEVGLPQDVSVISPQVDDPPEARWAPPEQRLSRGERRALREQRWADDGPPPPRIDARPLDAPPPEEDGDPQ